MQTFSSCFLHYPLSTHLIKMAAQSTFENSFAQLVDISITTKNGSHLLSNYCGSGIICVIPLALALSVSFMIFRFVDNVVTCSSCAWWWSGRTGRILSLAFSWAEGTPHTALLSCGLLYCGLCIVQSTVGKREPGGEVDSLLIHSVLTHKAFPSVFILVSLRHYLSACRCIFCFPDIFLTSFFWVVLGFEVRVSHLRNSASPGFSFFI
jgi:hypothetical protein